MTRVKGQLTGGHGKTYARLAGRMIECLESRAFLSAGSADPTFGPAHNGVALHEMLASTKDGVGAATLQRDGKLLISGTSRAVDGHAARAFVSRYLPDGTLDASFGTAHNGIAVLDLEQSFSETEPQGLRVQADGKIVVGLRIARDMVLFRFTSDGTLDKTFGPDKSGFVRATLDTGFATYLSDLILRPDGRILAGGYYYSNSARKDLVFMQFTADGVLDQTFGGGDGQATYRVTQYEDTIDAMTLLPSGMVLATGSCRGDFLAIRLFPDGGLDRTFGVMGVVKTDMGSGLDIANSVGLYRDGRFVLAGESGGDFAAARYTASGQLDTTFGAAKTGKARVDLGAVYDVAKDMAVQRDGKLVLVGQTQMPSATADDFRGAFAAVRIDVDGTLDSSFAVVLR